MRKALTYSLGLLLVVAAVSATHGYGSSPVVSDETPDNDSTLMRSSGELSEEGVVLGVNATDPVGGDVNVSFYNANSGDLIATNTSGGPRFTVEWGVDSFGDYSWYVEARDNSTNVTESGNFIFGVESSDSAAPSISFDERPSSTQATLDRTPTISGTLDEEAKISYRVDGGSYESITGEGSPWREEFEFTTDSLSNGEHTVTLRAEDRAGNVNVKSISFEEADGSEIAFTTNVDKSYPSSGIPIDPDSELAYDRDGVDFNFSLQGSGETHQISNSYQDGICSFKADDGWILNGNNWCGTEVPSSNQIDVNTDYELVANWKLRGEEHTRVIDGSFPIRDSLTWYSQGMSHGGMVEETVNEPDTSFSKDTRTIGETTYTCKGSTMTVSGISSRQIRCSNGVTDASKPPVVAWTYREGNLKSTSNNDMFNQESCSIEVNRPQIYGRTGDFDDQGYSPANCNLRWQMGGDGSFEASNFDETGDYQIHIDLINAISNSPDYICPYDAENTNICDQGSIGADTRGWNKDIKTEQVTVVDPSGTITSTSFDNVISETVGDTTYIRRKGYSGDINGTIDFQNTGVGNMEIKSMDVNCPSGVEDCEVVTDLPLKIREGQSSSITWEASPDGRQTGEITVEITYGDAYGLSCAGETTRTFKYFLDEADPETGEEIE